MRDHSVLFLITTCHSIILLINVSINKTFFSISWHWSSKIPCKIEHRQHKPKTKKIYYAIAKIRIFAHPSNIKIENRQDSGKDICNTWQRATIQNKMNSYKSMRQINYRKMDKRPELY